jgi:hypothetical protein
MVPPSLAPLLVEVPLASFVPLLAPYSRVLGVLVRDSCVSFAVTNHIVSSASAVGAVLRRNDQLPASIVSRYLRQEHLGGILLAQESATDNTHRNHAQLLAILRDVYGEMHGPEVLRGVDGGAASPAEGRKAILLAHWKSMYTPPGTPPPPGTVCSFSRSFLEEFIEAKGRNTFG